MTRSVFQTTAASGKLCSQQRRRTMVSTSVNRDHVCLTLCSAPQTAKYLWALNTCLWRKLNAVIIISAIMVFSEWTFLINLINTISIVLIQPPQYRVLFSILGPQTLSKNNAFDFFFSVTCQNQRGFSIRTIFSKGWGITGFRKSPKELFPCFRSMATFSFCAPCFRHLSKIHSEINNITIFKKQRAVVSRSRCSKE